MVFIGRSSPSTPLGALYTPTLAIVSLNWWFSYGDFAPTKNSTRLLFVPFILLGLAVRGR